MPPLIMRSITVTAVESDKPFTDPLEEEIMRDLVAIHNKFIALPNQNKFAVGDFTNGIHNLQRILSMRVMKKLFTDYFID